MARGRQGGALIASLITLTVLAMLAAAAFQCVTSRFKSNYQTAAWHNALTGAENGVQYSFTRLRSPLTANGVLTNPLKVPNSLQSDLATLSAGNSSTNGTMVAGSNGAQVQLPALVIPHLGEGSSSLASAVTVSRIPSTDVTGSGTNTWYRIRSEGTVPISGNASIGIQKYDNLLRKLRFKIDTAGNALTRPQAVRVIEVVAKPVTTGSAALFGQTGINLNNQNVVIDSYDSRSNTYSTDGIYDPAKPKKTANVVTNDDLKSDGSPGVINLSPTGAYVNGNIATNNVPVAGSTDHVSGTITQDFYQYLPNPPDPQKVSSIWVTVPSSSTALVAGTASVPMRYKIGGSGSLSYSGGSSLNIVAPTGGTGSIEIWIPGSLNITGNGAINIPDGVSVTFYIDGAVKIAGNGIANDSLKPANVTLYGNHDPSVSQTMTVDGNGRFAGVIYAPSADVSVKGGGSRGDMYGSITAENIFFNGVTSLHYDEALADLGAVIDYRLASWFEDNQLTR